MKKRKGKFRKSRLKLKDGNRISLPSGRWPKESRAEGWGGAGVGLGAGFAGVRLCLEMQTMALKACWSGPSCSVDGRLSGELFVVSDCRVYSDDKPTTPKLLKAWQSIEHTSLEAKAGEAWVSSG